MWVRNHVQLRDSNWSLVFRVLFEEGPISRTQISERIGLSQSVISTITADLQEKSLIREFGRDGDRVGRPSILLEINPAGGYFMSADLTGQSILVGVLDLSLHTVMTKSYDGQMPQGEPLYRQLVEAFTDVKKICTDKDMSVLGAGVATPGLVSQDGLVMEADNLGWEGMELKSRLRRDLDMDVVVVENDTNAAASGEFQFGSLRDMNVENMMLISIDTGIGCGLVLDGKLFSGSSGFAGELGHTVVDPDGPVCACGRRGCLESVAALGAMLRDYRLRKNLKRTVDYAELMNELVGKDDIAIEVVGRAARKIGQSIGNQVNVLNVNTVFLTGRFAASSDWFVNQVRDAVEEVAMLPYRSNLKVCRSTLGVHASLVGIASLCLMRVFFSKAS